jgi:Zn-dependent protease with chaperone function
VVGLASLYKWSQYSSGGSAVAEGVGARRIDPRTADLSERRLLNVVEEMAIAAGIPVPAVFLLEDEPGINAFAAGLTTSDAAVCVTSGTMQKLTRDELQGVIAHEFSHILNGDMRLNLRIAAIVFGILVLGLAGRGILWSLRGARAPRGKNSGGAVVAILVIGVALLVIGYVGYFFGRMIQAAVSRQREFLADASSVQFTRNPGAITGALKKIGGYALGSSLQTEHAAAIGHFFFAQGFTSAFGALWATHLAGRPHPRDRSRVRRPDVRPAGGDRRRKRVIRRRGPRPCSVPPPFPTGPLGRPGVRRRRNRHSDLGADRARPDPD